jgi:hypothetical protein
MRKRSFMLDKCMGLQGGWSVSNAVHNQHHFSQNKRLSTNRGMGVKSKHRSYIKWNEHEAQHLAQINCVRTWIGWDTFDPNSTQLDNLHPHITHIIDAQIYNGLQEFQQRMDNYYWPCT